MATFEQEAEALSRLRHPNILLLMGVAWRCPRPIVVTELASGGDLFSELRKCRRAWATLTSAQQATHPWTRPADQRRMHTRVALQAAAGLAHAHETGYSHGDIKSPNILLTRENQAKIADFGLSAFWWQREAGGGRTVDPAAPPSGRSTLWAAPELFKGQRAGFASDVYAFGVVLFEVATCEEPFSEEQVPKELKAADVRRLVQAGMRPDLRLIDAGRCALLAPKAEFCALLERCWSPEPGIARRCWRS